MTEHPFPVRPLESMWRDDAWNWVDDEAAECKHGNNSWDCHECRALVNLWAARLAAVNAAAEPAPDSNLSEWLAVIIVAAFGALCVGGAALLCEVIGL